MSEQINTSGNRTFNQVDGRPDPALLQQSRRRAAWAPSGLDILQDLHIAMSQEDERVLAFAARVLDAQQAPPLQNADDDALNVPYPGTRWQLTPDGGLRKVPRRRAKADAIATRSHLRRYFIQVLQHRRDLEKLLSRGEGLAKRHAELMMQLRRCTDELFTVGQRLLATAPLAHVATAAQEEDLPCEGNDHGL